MARILIVDDEAPARAWIRSLLTARMEDHEIAEASNALEALTEVERLAPEIVFLDVEMPRMSGLELLQQIAAPSFEVVFQTAHDEFAVRAFELNACDYLLKPFTEERFRAAFERALSRLRTGTGPEPSGVRRLVDSLPTQSRYLRRLIVKLSPTRSRFIEESEIVHFLSVEHATEVHLLGNLSYAVNPSLSELEKQLDPARFMRIHRNAIVRIDCVEGYRTQPEFQVMLKGGTALKVARDRQKRILELLKR